MFATLAVGTGAVLPTIPVPRSLRSEGRACARTRRMFGRRDPATPRSSPAPWCVDPHSQNSRQCPPGAPISGVCTSELERVLNARCRFPKTGGRVSFGAADLHERFNASTPLQNGTLLAQQRTVLTKPGSPDPKPSQPKTRDRDHRIRHVEEAFSNEKVTHF